LAIAPRGTLSRQTTDYGQMTDLAGKVAVITGGGRGIGAAIALNLAGQGARVVVGELEPERAKAPSRDGGAKSIVAMACDVRKFEDLVALHDAALSEHGHIDYVIANAGVTDWGLMSDGDPDRWRAVLETNVLGTALTIRATLPTLLRAGRGHIVITASISGRVTYVGEPLYIASKWALVGLGRALRKEVAGSGIRVTLIEPGIVDTPLVSGTDEGRRELAQLRALRPEDVAEVVAFALAQPDHVDIDELVISPTEQVV
jgi:NADP-dependent 3-hydroxy acid dehydrogenase YdfG